MLTCLMDCMHGLMHLAQGPGVHVKSPETMRLKIIKAAAIKIMKVNRAFSRIPRIFKPATAQIMARTGHHHQWVRISGKKEVALDTALTAEMQAVRM